MAEEIKLDLGEKINLRDFGNGEIKEENDAKNEKLLDIISDGLRSHYGESINLLQFQKFDINAKFGNSYGFKIHVNESRPSDAPKLKEYIIKQYSDRKMFEEIKSNYLFLNQWDNPKKPKEPGEPQQWKWGGLGDPNSKLFEYLYASAHSMFDLNNITLVESILQESVDELVTRLKGVNEKDQWQFEKPLDPIILLNDWAFAKIKSEKKEAQLKEFDYKTFFDKAFDGMKKLYSINDNGKDYARDATEKLREKYFDKCLYTTIYLGYPRRNRQSSLVNPEGFCLGPRTLHLGCHYGDYSVFNRMDNPEARIGVSLDDLLKKKAICRDIYMFHSYLSNIDKKFLEDGTYFGAVMANFYTAGSMQNISEDEANGLRSAIEKQIGRIHRENFGDTRQLEEMITAHKK